MKLRFVLIVAFASLALLLAACNFTMAADVTPPPNYVPPTPVAALGPLFPAQAPSTETGAMIFADKCAACHGAASPTLAEFQLDQKKYTASMKGPRIDTYADLLALIGWPDTGAIMRRLDDGKSAGGKPGNMYNFLGSSDEERQKNLQTFKAWVGSDGWALNRFKARGEVPGISKEQLEKIQVKY